MWRRRIVGVVALVLATVGPSDAEARKRAKAGTELAPADLWTQPARSARVVRPTPVLRVAGRRERFGKLAVGTRIGWRRIVASGDRCRAYLELEPRGFVCAADTAPSDQPPAPADWVDPAHIVEHAAAEPHVGVVPTGARAFDSPDAIRHGGPAKKLKGWRFLRQPLGSIEVAGVAYRKTTEGYVADRALMPRPPSSFEGVELTGGAGLPFGWIVPRTRNERVTVRAAPAARAAAVRELDRRARVAILEERDGFARIGPDEWVALRELRIARASRRPGGVRPDERWLDLDLDQQVMVAYEGDAPVFATLVSTGLGASTPPSLHRIRKKLAITRLISPAVALGEWDLPDVPFSMQFRQYYALHAAYWHDGFGKPRSQGCVNVSLRDARRLFDWTLPRVEPGWLEGRGDDGTPIRIRNRRVPDPDWTDFDAPPPVAVRDPAATPRSPRP